MNIGALIAAIWGSNNDGPSLADIWLDDGDDSDHRAGQGDYIRICSHGRFVNSNCPTCDTKEK